jgi:hypothetical protein
MRYRLDELASLAADVGLSTERIDDNRLDVLIHDGCRLAFCNLPAEDDTLVGFDGTPWHSHGIVQFLTGDSTYIECDELQILVGLDTGELVIVTEYIAGRVSNRWIAHVNEPLALRDINPGEELRVFRLPERTDVRIASADV